MVFLSFVPKWVRHKFTLPTILLLGLILRFVIVYPGYYSHGDELMYAQAVYMITHKTLSMQLQWLGYPPLVGWIMLVAFAGVFIPAAWFLTLVRHFNDIWMFLLPAFAGLLGVVFLLRKLIHWDNRKTLVVSLLFLWVVLIISGTIAISQTNLFHKEVFGRNWANALYWGRYLTAIFGSGAIYLTYQVAHTLLGKKSTALLAAFLVAVNYRLILSSHIGFIDMYNVFFLLAVLLAVGALLKEPTLKRYLICGVLVSLSFLTKYQIYAFFPFFLAHLVISWKYSKKNLKKFWAEFLSPKVIIGGLVSLGIVLISHIHYFQHWERVLELHRYEAAKYAFGLNTISIFPASYMYHFGVGAQLTWFAIFGILIGFLKKDLRLTTLLLLSIFPINIYLYMYYTGGGFFTRNTIVLIPMLLIFSALCIEYIFNLLFKRKGLFIKMVGAIFFVGALFFGLKDHVINDKIMIQGYSQKSTFIEAREWTEKNIKGDVTLATYEHNPSSKDKQVQVKSLSYLSKVFSYKELKQEGYDYAILDMNDIQGAFMWWMRQSPEIGIKFWNKPNDLLSQNYIALALRETLWSHTLKAFLTRWQAAGDNYVVFRLEKDKNQEFLSIAKYTFEDNKWTPLYYLPKDKEDLKVDKDGRDGNEALVIKSRGSFPGSVRWQSPYFEVKSGYGYKLVGWIKNVSELAKESRDGFLRLDFYSEEVPASITARPIVSFVSERIYGKSEWHKVEVYGTAPEGTRLGAIGFQGDNPQVGFYLDSVEVMETRIRQPASDLQPTTILDDDLFLPNNRGIL